MHSLFSDLFLPVTLAVITMGMGLSLTEKDFQRIFLKPRAVITGLLSQMILLPLLAFFIARLSHMDPYFKMGLMIIAACPGGATSNLITYLLRGNVALSISMTAINSIITLITIPLVVTLSLEFFMHQDTHIQMQVGETMLNVFLITILPAWFGTRIRKWKPELADRLERPLQYVLPTLLALIYAGVIFIDGGSESATIKEMLGLFPMTLSLHMGAMGLGLLVAWIARLKLRDRYTIAIEVGLQNSALAIFVAATLLNSQYMAIVPVVYGSFTFFTTLLFAWLIKRVLIKKPIDTDK